MINIDEYKPTIKTVTLEGYQIVKGQLFSRQLEKIEYLIVTDSGLAENLIAVGLVPTHQIEKLSGENRADHVAVLDFLFPSAGCPP